MSRQDEDLREQSYPTENSSKILKENSCYYESMNRELKTLVKILVYYESIKRDLKIKPISECRYYERLKTKTEEYTHLTWTGLFGELEHLKIKTRLRFLLFF